MAMTIRQDYKILAAAIRSNARDMANSGHMPHPHVVAILAANEALFKGVLAGFALRHALSLANLRLVGWRG